MNLLKKYLSPDVEDAGGYGYEDDTTKSSPFNFGLNAGAARLTKFEWINNAGKEGAEQEALDVVFKINGVDKSYRIFPITKVFNKQGGEITDTSSEEYKKAKDEAYSNLRKTIVHILHSFVDDTVVKPALSRPFKTFKEYVQAAAAILPNNFAEKPLDIFLQYQWNISPNQNRTYLDIPKKLSYGPWLKPAQPGTWKAVKEENISEDTKVALKYVNENGDIHPFTKNGWFMLSNFANQQRLEGEGESSAAGAAMNSGTTTNEASTPTPSAAPPASAW